MSDDEDLFDTPAKAMFRKLDRVKAAGLIDSATVSRIKTDMTKAALGFGGEAALPAANPAEEAPARAPPPAAVAAVTSVAAKAPAVSEAIPNRKPAAGSVGPQPS